MCHICEQVERSLTLALAESLRNPQPSKDMDGATLEVGDLVTYYYESRTKMRGLARITSLNPTISERREGIEGAIQILGESSEKNYFTNESWGSGYKVRLLGKVATTEWESKVFPVQRAALRRSVDNVRSMNDGNNNNQYDKIFYWLLYPHERDCPIPAWILSSVAISEKDPTQISWATRMEDVVDPKRRRYTKFSKFLRWLNHEKYLSYDDERINKVTMQWGDAVFDYKNFSFELVSGEELIEAFRDGPRSCMKLPHGEYSKGVYLYAQNPRTVQLLKIYLRGVYKGRALVWTLDSGRKMMDRVYPGQFFYDAAIIYAKEQGWIYRDEYNTNLSEYPGTATSRYTGYHTVTFYNDGTHYDEATIQSPYLDSLMYMEPKWWDSDAVYSKMVLRTKI